jgi:hypothetical protein
VRLDFPLSFSHKLLQALGQPEMQVEHNHVIDVQLAAIPARTFFWFLNLSVGGYAPRLFLVQLAHNTGY